MIKIIFNLIVKVLAHFRMLHLKIEELMIERNKLKKEIERLRLGFARRDKGELNG